MRAIPVIVLEVGTYQSDEMAFPEDDDVFERLAAAAADPAFRRRVLPRTAVGDATGLDAHRPESIDNGRTENRVPVEYEMPWRGVVRERLAQLLDHPGRCGIGSKSKCVAGIGPAEESSQSRRRD